MSRLDEAKRKLQEAYETWDRNMAEAAVKLPEKEELIIRRFELADLSRHGSWLLQRVRKYWPHLTDHTAGGLLRGLIYSVEHCFLYAEHGVGLAQIERIHSLIAAPVIHEKFVIAEKGYEEACGIFYEEFARWGRHMGADMLYVSDLTDVPEDEIKRRIGRVMPKQQRFVKL